MFDKSRYAYSTCIHRPNKYILKKKNLPNSCIPISFKNKRINSSFITCSGMRVYGNGWNALSVCASEGAVLVARFIIRMMTIEEEGW